MKRFLLALLVLAPCAASCKHATSSSSTAHSETSTTTDTTSSETGATTTTTTQTEGPGKTTTTVEDYGPPEEVMPSESDESGGLRTGADGGVPATPGVVSRSSRGPLVRRTVTVTEHGQETTQTRQEATQQATGATETRAAAQADTKAQAASETKPSAGCVGASWIWGLAALAFAGLVIFGIVRLRRG